MLITSDKVKSIMINNKDPVEYVEHQEAEWEDYSKHFSFMEYCL